MFTYKLHFIANIERMYVFMIDVRQTFNSIHWFIAYNGVFIILFNTKLLT